MTDITYGGSSLGQVQSLKERTDGGLFAFPIPQQSAGSCLIYDLGGNTRAFEVETKYVSTIGGIGSILNLMDTWANGRQGTGKSLALPFGRSSNCVIQRWEWFTDSNMGGETDTGSNLMITLRIDFAFGTIVSI